MGKEKQPFMARQAYEDPTPAFVPYGAPRRDVVPELPTRSNFAEMDTQKPQVELPVPPPVEPPGTAMNPREYRG